MKSLKEFAEDEVRLVEQEKLQREAAKEYVKKFWDIVILILNKHSIKHIDITNLKDEFFFSNAITYDTDHHGIDIVAGEDDELLHQQLRRKLMPTSNVVIVDVDDEKLINSSITLTMTYAQGGDWMEPKLTDKDVDKLTDSGFVAYDEAFLVPVAYLFWPMDRVEKDLFGRVKSGKKKASERAQKEAEKKKKAKQRKAEKEAKKKKLLEKMSAEEKKLLGLK